MDFMSYKSDMCTPRILQNWSKKLLVYNIANIVVSNTLPMQNAVINTYIESSVIGMLSNIPHQIWA